MSSSKKKPMPALAPLDAAAFNAAAVAIPDPVSVAISSSAIATATPGVPTGDDQPLPSKLNVMVENVPAGQHGDLSRRDAKPDGQSNRLSPTQPSRAGKVQLSVWVRAEKRLQLKRRALDLGRPVDEIVNELIDGFLR